MVGTTIGTRGRWYCMKFNTNIYLTSKEVFNLCFVQLLAINTCSWGPSFQCCRLPQGNGCLGLQCLKKFHKDWFSQLRTNNCIQQISDVGQNICKFYTRRVLLQCIGHKIIIMHGHHCSLGCSIYFLLPWNHVFFFRILIWNSNVLKFISCG